MKSKSISVPVFAGILVLLALLIIYQRKTSKPKSVEADERMPIAKSELADLKEKNSKFKPHDRTLPALITNLDKAEELLMHSGIDLSNRDKFTAPRAQALIRRIAPSLYGELLSRIDTSLAESGYFKFAHIPEPANLNTEWHPVSESDSMKDFFRQFLVGEWAAHDLDEALAYAMNADPVRYQEPFAIAALSAQVADAPLDSMSRVAGLTNPELRDRVRQEVYRAWLKESPKTALSWASEWPDTRQRGAYMGMWGSEIGSNDPILALNIAAEIKADEQRRALLGGIGSAWSLQDPQAMATYLGDDCHSNPAENQGMVSSLLYNWYQRDKQAALNWMAGLGEGSTRAEAEKFLTQKMKVEWPGKSR